MKKFNELRFDEPKYNEHGELINKCGCVASKGKFKRYLIEVDEALEKIKEKAEYFDEEVESYSEEYYLKLAEHIAYNAIECDCESKMIYTGSCCCECGKEIYVSSKKYEEMQLQTDLYYNEDDDTIQNVRNAQVTRIWDERTQQFYATRGIADVFREMEEESQEKLNIFDSIMDEYLHVFVCYCTPPSEFDNTLESENKFNEVDEEFVRVRRIAKENGYECDFEGLFDDDEYEDDEDEDDEEDDEEEDDEEEDEEEDDEYEND